MGPICVLLCAPVARTRGRAGAADLPCRDTTGTRPSKVTRYEPEVQWNDYTVRAEITLAARDLLDRYS